MTVAEGGRSDLAEARELLRHAPEAMVFGVVPIDPSASIGDAAEQAILREKGPLPVVEGDRLHATVTDWDHRPGHQSIARGGRRARA